MWTPLLLLPWWLLKSLLVVFLMRMGWINYSGSELGHCSPCSRCLNVSVQTEKEDGLTRCHLSSHAASVAKNDHSIKQIQRHKDTHTACTTALCAVCFRWLTETVSHTNRRWLLPAHTASALLHPPCFYNLDFQWYTEERKGREGDVGGSQAMRVEVKPEQVSLERWHVTLLSRHWSGVGFTTETPEQWRVVTLLSQTAVTAGHLM